MARGGGGDAAVWRQASTGLVLLDESLALREANAAATRWLAAAEPHWRGQGVAGVLGEPLAAIARLARDEGRVTHLREWRAPACGERFEVAAGPLAGEGLAVLLEFWPKPAFALPEAAAELPVLLHELRNPLAGLRGAAQLLARLALPADGAELVALILGEADRLAAMLERRRRPSAAVRSQAINPHRLLERLRSLLAAEAPGLRLERDYDPSLPEGAADPEALHGALLNLGRNAIAAGATRIVLRSRAEPGAVLGGRRWRLALRIEIEDDGEGVPPALGARIFEPLVSGRAGGSGLGLALARETAEAHGGELDFRSRPGLTCFVLRLPWEVPDA